MYLSQKFMVATPKPAPGQELDEQQIIQQQTMKTMPLVTTGMFLFIPLPTGVFLYLVVSNVFQTLQTWLIMKMPAPALLAVTDDGPVVVEGNGPAAQDKKTGANDPKNGKSPKPRTQGGKKGVGGNGQVAGNKKKSKRKKN
jgi:YidC/Oxa1 family membrane protein insertase